MIKTLYHSLMLERTACNLMIMVFSSECVGTTVN